MSNRNIPHHTEQQQQQQQQQQGLMELERSKKGQCPTCGTLTHKIERTLFGRKQRQPLTIEGQVLRGICLVCQGPSATTTFNVGARNSFASKIPNNNNNHNYNRSANRNANMNVNLATTNSLPAIPTTSATPTTSNDNNNNNNNNNTGIPQVLEVKLRNNNNNDDATVVSQITLDHRLLSGNNNNIYEEISDDDTSHFRVRPGERRPEPSLCDGADDPRPPERYRQQSQQQQSQQQSEIVTAQVSRVVPRMPSHSSSRAARINNTGTLPPFAEEKTEIEAASSLPSTTTDNTNNNDSPLYGNQMSNWSVEEEEEEQEEEESGNNGIHNNTSGGSYPHDHPHQNHPYKTTTTATGMHQQHQYQHSLDEIPALVEQLQLQLQSTNTNVSQALVRLADIVAELGQAAKVKIANCNGLAGITQSMWSSMGGDAVVQQAALLLLFGLAANDNDNYNYNYAGDYVMVGESADDAVDALLIVMQQFLTVEHIQYYGCGVISCLASASGDFLSDDNDNDNNVNANVAVAVAVNDGSLSGALVSVVSAMEAHRHSKGIQEWGIRCLYNLCVYSKHAESNKRILAKTGLQLEHDNNNNNQQQQQRRQCGAAIIYQVIELSDADIVTMEWACRLYWCLSASEDVAGYLTITHHPIHVMLEALQRFYASSAGLVEAIFGALTNLVKLGENYKVMDSSVMYLIIKAAQEHRKNEMVQMEAFALIANLVSLSPDNADVAVDAEVIKFIFKSIKSFPYNAELFEEATRALACLCIISEDAKGHLSTPTMLSYLSLANTTHKDSIIGQEMFFYLLSSILTQKSFWKTLVAHGGVDMIVTSMKNHPHERRVQEAACLTMRNLACGDTDAAPVDFSEPINLILSAMTNHPSSPSIQLNSCCALWNLAFVKNQFRYDVSDNDMIQHIVKAMQNHMESAPVLEMACGALCSKICGSKERKQSLVESGGLDAVTCVLVMHPDETAALENACGVLSSMSVNVDTNSGFADEVKSSQCLNNVVEAMRTNSSSITLLEFGCMVLRNIILVHNEYGEEISSVIATILQTMQENPDAVDFQRESCSLLWAMAAVSESCKAKILSLDGIAVLLSCLEHNSSFSDVQDAALGAFNQLSF